MRIDVLRLFLIAVFVAALSGCSAKPSDEDMKAALLRVMTPVTGPSTTIDSFEARNCEGFDNGVYRCDVKAVMRYTFELGGRSQEKTQPFVGLYDFIERPDGWKLVN